MNIDGTNVQRLTNSAGIDDEGTIMGGAKTTDCNTPATPAATTNPAAPNTGYGAKDSRLAFIGIAAGSLILVGTSFYLISSRLKQKYVFNRSK